MTVTPHASTLWAVPDPFLHEGPDRVYSPLADRVLLDGEPGYWELRALMAGGLKPEEIARDVYEGLRSAGFLVDSPSDRAYESKLKYVSLETHTVCNQKCYFCPVSVDPRKTHFMADELFESIVLQLAAYRDTLEAIWLMLYNEPTLDKRFLDLCDRLFGAGLPVAVNTNATGLTPERIDHLVANGPLRHLSVNLSTLDRERYAQDRGADQLPQVLRNLDYARDKQVAQEMVIMVLGQGDDNHRADIAAVERRFSGSCFEVQNYEIMDRAGYLEVGHSIDSTAGRLCGCENVGSRPLQHLHITPRGRVVLCCEDYDENYVVGDLAHQSIAEVLAGEALAALRRQAYGLDASSPDFLCNNCIFALRREG